MKRFVLVLCPLLMSSAVLLAQDASLLRRLQEETRELAQATEGVVVPVVADRVQNWGAGHRGWTFTGDGKVATFWNNNRRVDHRLALAQLGRAGKAHGTPVSGVLVGSPARLVVPYAAVGKAATVHVSLDKGKNVVAKRIDGDAEIGVAVYALPEKEAKQRQGLTVETDWDQLRAGSLAVASDGGGGLLALTVLHGGDQRSGRLEIAANVAGAALVAPGKKLLGLRNTSVAMNCVECHTVNDPATKKNGTLGRLVAGDLAGLAAGNAYVAARNSYVTLSGVHAAQPAASGGFIAGPVIGRVLDDIEKHGRIRHSYLGVILGETVGRGKEAGVTITAVLDGSPAQAAGLSAGERVTAIDGLPCGSATTLSRALVLRRPEETITLKLAPENREVKVTLSDRAAAQKHFVTPDSVGLGCVDITPGLRAWLGLNDDVSGVVVQSVQRGSNAAKAGLQRGDVIIGGGGGGVADLEELNAALAGAKGSVELRWLRKGREMTMSMKIQGAKGTR